ncbi:MAG TPA: LPS assembly protein LptD, partial [Thermoanaerobaculia bacterium]|nr:LPS assembly protein LptD [Thermoanaerobaculia bacterium]
VGASPTPTLETEQAPAASGLPALPSGVQPPATPGAQPPNPPKPPTPTPAAEAPNRINFDLHFPPSPKDKTGGSAAGSAASLEYKRDDYAVLTGAVKVKYQDIDIAADRAEIDLKARTVTATGNVVVDQGPRRMSGDTLTWDLDLKTGTLSNATAQLDPDYYFTGREIEKTGDDTYAVTDGTFSSCSQKVPDWSFRLGRATVQVEGYARVYNATMKVKKLPVLYTPFILWPAKRDRTSGFLIPNIGFSGNRGFTLGLAYYQVLGRSYDTTFHLDTYSKSFFGVGDEFRYHPTEGTEGQFVGYTVHDPVLKEERWKVQLNHVTEDLPFGMRGVISFLRYSDFNFAHDFERDFNVNTLRSIYSRGFITGNWGPHSLNLLLDDRETFVDTTSTIEQRKLPELEYRLRSTKLGPTPLYLEMRSSIDYLDIARPLSYAGKYSRVDLFPELTLPIRTFPWLSVSVTAGERATFYGDHLDATGQTFTGRPLTETFPVASAEIVGPSFSRIFTADIGPFGKFKHVIEPRFTYNYQGEVKNPQEVPLFDEVDFQQQQNSARVALDNRLLGKPKAGGTDVSAREIFLFEVARNYSFLNLPPTLTSTGDTLTSVPANQASPLEALLRFNPTNTTSLKAQADYDTNFKRLVSTEFSANTSLGKDTVSLSWFTRHFADTGETLGNQVRFGSVLDLFSHHLQLEGQINYDVQLKLLQQQRYVINYTSQCYGLRLELRDFRTATGLTASSLENDREIRLSISLKNVGTFLDLNSRSTNYQ